MFGPGFSEADLRVRASEGDLILSFAGREDRIVIENALSYADFIIDQVNFFDAPDLGDGQPDITHAELLGLAFAGTDADQVLGGSFDADTIDAGAGADRVIGYFARTYVRQNPRALSHLIEPDGVDGVRQSLQL